MLQNEVGRFIYRSVVASCNGGVGSGLSNLMVQITYPVKPTSTTINLTGEKHDKNRRNK
jgi:ABC-type transporter Mla maintaining outer membrane lipid asymmetry ATPase subunit MlaF